MPVMWCTPFNRCGFKQAALGRSPLNRPASPQWLAYVITLMFNRDWNRIKKGLAWINQSIHEWLFTQSKLRAFLALYCLLILTSRRILFSMYVKLSRTLISYPRTQQQNLALGMLLGRNQIWWRHHHRLNEPIEKEFKANTLTDAEILFTEYAHTVFSSTEQQLAVSELLLFYHTSRCLDSTDADSTVQWIRLENSADKFRPFFRKLIRNCSHLSSALFGNNARVKRDVPCLHMAWRHVKRFVRDKFI